MSDVTFEWDLDKAAANVRKHGVSFEEAATAFADPRALLMPDPDHSLGEQRLLLLARSRDARILLVVHCERMGGTIVRLISARTATRRERLTYLSWSDER